MSDLEKAYRRLDAAQNALLVAVTLLAIAVVAKILVRVL